MAKLIGQQVIPDGVPCGLLCTILTPPALPGPSLPCPAFDTASRPKTTTRQEGGETGAVVVVCAVWFWFLRHTCWGRGCTDSGHVADMQPTWEDPGTCFLLLAAGVGACGARRPARPLPPLLPLRRLPASGGEHCCCSVAVPGCWELLGWCAAPAQCTSTLVPPRAQRVPCTPSSLVPPALACRLRW